MSKSTESSQLRLEVEGALDLEKKIRSAKIRTPSSYFSGFPHERHFFIYSLRVCLFIISFHIS